MPKADQPQAGALACDDLARTKVRYSKSSNMPIHFYIGMTAAVLTTTAFLPQVIKAHRSKHTGDLSLLMYSMFTIGVFLWVIYGFIFGELPIIIANCVTFLLSLYILFLKIRYG